MKQIITSLFIGLSIVVMAQTKPYIEVKTDTTNIRIGEQISYTISAPINRNVVFPKLSNLEGLEVAEELGVDTLQNELLKKYLITGFDSGAFYIKKQQVYIDAKAYFTDSLLINVSTISVDTVKLAKYYSVKDLEEEAYTFGEWWYWVKSYVYIGLAVIIFVIALYFLFRNKKEPVKQKKIVIPPYIEATKELKKLEKKQLWQNDKVKEYYSELTDIVRKYIGNELFIQALETTTEEMMTLLVSENKQQKLGLDKETLSILRDLLSQGDFVKFAKQKPIEMEIQGHRSNASSIIETIHKIVESKKEEVEDDKQQ
ncbi:MAG: hypothetical protein ACN4EF_02725 [Wenyingzhuangia sp.]|jgi:hypothetical protein|uniref:hypothetical protein n=1 Tax=Wenyingzhuangia sp. TaxID=1964193 RepID=UPI00321C2D4A